LAQQEAIKQGKPQERYHDAIQWLAENTKDRSFEDKFVSAAKIKDSLAKQISRCVNGCSREGQLHCSSPTGSNQAGEAPGTLS
jgi:ribosomal protein S7